MIKVKKLNKIFISAFLSCIFLLQGTNIVFAKEKDSPSINVDSKSALLMEPTTGKIIYEKNSHEKYAPASVTKIMTMLLTIEAVDNHKIKLSDKVTVSENAKKMGQGGNSSMLLDTGEVRTVEDLLKGVAIASGNDAAVALAEYLGGSQENFVKLMNKRAQELGMKDTTFKNCHGISVDGHLTTAYDISIMSRELLKHPKIFKFTGTYMETISEGRKKPIELVNHNKLVRFFKGCDGLKTGFTNEAKYCISATAKRNNVRMLAIIMGAPTYKIRNKEASNLLNYGFSKFENKRIMDKDSTIEKVPLNKKGDRFFIAKAGEDLNLVVERGDNNKITKKIVIDKSKKEYKRGQNVGYCEVYIGNKLYKKIPIYSDRDIRAYSMIDNIKDNVRKIFDNAI